MRDHRITKELTEKLDAWHVANEVIYSIDADSPDYTDFEDMDSFFKNLDPIQGKVFAAWIAHNWVVTGGLFHIFEMCSKPMIEAAIAGYQLLNEPEASSMIREACQIFPGGQIPKDHDLILEYLDSSEGWETLSPEVRSGRLSVSRSYHDFFDFDNLLKEHYQSFVKEEK